MGRKMTTKLNEKLEYKIDAKMVDELYQLKNKLKQTDRWSTHKVVAGLCLLGEKDGIVDEFEPMITSDGCWEMPKIDHNLFYKSFTKLTKKDRRTIGMAVIKPATIGEKISSDVKDNIFRLRKTFEDITQTVWIIVSDDNVISYRPYRTKSGTLDVRALGPSVWINKKESLIMKMADAKEIAKAMARTTKTNKLIPIINTITKDMLKGKEETLEVNLKQLNREVRKQKKELRIQTAEKEKKKEEVKTIKGKTYIGNGLYLIKSSDGKEILWTES